MRKDQLVVDHDAPGVTGSAEGAQRCVKAHLLLANGAEDLLRTLAIDEARQPLRRQRTDEAHRRDGR